MGAYSANEACVNSEGNTVVDNKVQRGDRPAMFLGRRKSNDELLGLERSWEANIESASRVETALRTITSAARLPKGSRCPWSTAFRHSR
ncbi:MAG: hypothetical protein ACI8X5_001179 [Planctomycetota bacterium]|jgi:hypothetical protein